MAYLVDAFWVLLAGSGLLAAGILLNKVPGESSEQTVADCVAWVVGFLVSFGAEFYVFANV